MTTPAYSELVTAVRREGEGIVTAAGMGLDAEVPSCPGWDVARLVNHISKIYGYVTAVVSTRATESPERPPLPDGDPVEVLSDLLDDLVASLSDIDGDTPVWNWSDDADNVGIFWARRMAHESSVHRFDAQAAHGVMQPIDSELAADGIDELIDMVVPRIYRRDDLAPGPTGTIALRSTDADSWYLELAPSQVSRVETITTAQVTVRGTSSALLLAAYSRVRWSALEIEGDETLLADWTSVLSF